MATNSENCESAICLEYFEDRKDLHCEHGRVFCKKCLEDLMEPDNTINCPESRETPQVLGGDMEKMMTHLKTKCVIENYICVNCRTLDKLCKPCGKCRVRSCPVCICRHDNGEKCELFGKVREVTRKLPNQPQIEAMDQLEEKWDDFRKKNSEQRKETDSSMTKLIKSLQQRRTDLLTVFDKYEKYAIERIDLIRQSKQIKNSLQDIINKVNDMKIDDVKLASNAVEKHEEMISKKDAVLAEVVPDPLGRVSTYSVQTGIRNIGNQITRREPGKDAEVDLVFSTEGSVYDTKSDWPSTELAKGQIQIHRSKGGRYQLKVVDKKDASKILKSFEWNNRSQDAQTSKMISQLWCHVPWMLKTGDREVEYTTRIADYDRRCGFRNVMNHADLVDKA